MKHQFIEVPAQHIVEIRHHTERREVEESGTSIIAISHIIYARKDSTGDWVLRLTTGVEYVLDCGFESTLTKALLQN